MAVTIDGNTGIDTIQDGTVSTAKIADDAVTAGKIGIPLGRRNLIMNGNMEVNQRSFSSNTARTQFTYAGDRWIFAKNDVVNYDSSYNSFSLGQTDIPGAKAYHEFTLNSAGSGTDYVRLEQRIEDVTTAAGEQVTLTFWARSNTGSSFTLDADGITAGPVAIMQYFGTGGSPSSAVETDFATSITLNTTWTKYTYTVTLPSVSGKTIGTNYNDHLRLWICAMMDDDAGKGVQIAQVQLERGSTASPFEFRSYQDELHSCHRYYEVIGRGERAQNGSIGVGTIGSRWTTRDYFGQICYAPKRTVPVLSIRNGTVQIMTDASTQSGVTPTFQYIGVDTAGMRFQGSTHTNNVVAYAQGEGLQINVDAEY